jgi:hypothetical protein
MVGGESEENGWGKRSHKKLLLIYSAQGVDGYLSSLLSLPKHSASQ